MTLEVAIAWAPGYSALLCINVWKRSLPRDLEAAEPGPIIKGGKTTQTIT